jgi:aminopeptidase N
MLASLLGIFLYGTAQPAEDTLWKNVYRESYPRLNDLVNTRLSVFFDYDSAYMFGEEWITLKPHFYPIDSLNVDAKQMDIHEVAAVKGSSVVVLKYNYDGWMLKIKLDREYTAAEKYIIYIRYTSKPNKARVPPDAKGLYFINPKGDQKDKPTQIWTDGETEKTSMWCPTIDKPDQKSTSELILTVPARYVTLSNGRLVSQKSNADHTRTDDWKMELPISPYVFFMAVGDFAITKDWYKGKEVNYYTEKEYTPTARRIFGETPAMMAFFEQISGIPFPWVKYSQIVLRDFTSTAMENTTATAHAERAQQDARELSEGNTWENNIAHELFHQWFGDYVTCESWSNLTLNESMARYGEYLWQEHRHGADAAGEENFTQMRNYLDNPGDAAKPLVRFYYADPEDMFDGVSYGKGSLVLHMLRNYIGDSAFFKGLKVYLARYKFQSAEVHQFRMVMQEVSGKDLNWFFNQWYFGSGHPKVTIAYRYDDSAKKVTVSIAQTQGADHLFSIPLDIDVYEGAAKKSRSIWLTNEMDSFSFSYRSRPDLVNVDSRKIILWDKTDNKTLANFIYQYRVAGNYLDRREAISACARQQQDPRALDLLKMSLLDRYEGLREFTMSGLDMENESTRLAVEPIIFSLAREDKKASVRALAFHLLGYYQKKEAKDLLVGALDDSSYFVAGAALGALATQDSVLAFSEAKRLAALNAKWALANVAVVTLIKFGSEDDFDFICEKFASLSFRIRSMRNFAEYLGKIRSPAKFMKGIDIIAGFRQTVSPAFISAINKEILGGLLTKKLAAGLEKEAAYIKNKLPE